MISAYESRGFLLHCFFIFSQISTIRECKAAVECAGGIFVDAMEQEACLKDGLIISAGDTPMPENARMARSIAMELGVRFENFNRRVLIMTGDFVEDLQTKIGRAWCRERECQYV